MTYTNPPARVGGSGYRRMPYSQQRRAWVFYEPPAPEKTQPQVADSSFWMGCWLAMVMMFECMFAAVADVFNAMTKPVLSVKQVYEPTDESSYHPLVKALALYLLITVFAASPITKIVCVVFIAKYVRQHLGR